MLQVLGVNKDPWVVSQAASTIEHMFDLQTDAELGVTSSRDLFDEIRCVEREISRGRALQVRLLRELMRRRSFLSLL